MTIDVTDVKNGKEIGFEEMVMTVKAALSKRISQAKKLRRKVIAK